MAINSNIKDPFNPDQENDSSSARWFGMRTLQAVALAGVGFGIYKIKGPAGKLVNKYLQQRVDAKLSDDIMKIQDSHDWLLGKDYVAKPENFGLTEIDKPAPTVEFKIFTTNTDIEFALEEISSIENKIASKITNDMVLSNFTTSSQADITKIIKSHAINFSLKFKKDLFYNVKLETLFLFLEKNPPLSPNDFSIISSIKNNPTSINKKKLEEMHNAYVSTYIGYVRKYKENISKHSKLYYKNSSSFKTDPATVGSIIKEKDAIVLFSGDSRFSSDSTDFFHSFVNAAAWKEGKKKEIIVPEIEDIVKHGKTFTSGSLDGSVHLSASNLYSRLGTFDYFPLMKKIVDRLEDIKRTISKNINLNDIAYELIPKGKSNRPNWNLKVTFMFKGQNSLHVEIPISQWGVVSGRFDRLHELPNGPRNVYKQVTLDINKDFENTTQKAFREFLKGIDSTILSNEAKFEPVKAVTTLQRMVDKVIQQAPIAENVTTDAVKAMIIQPYFTKKYQTPLALSLLEDAVTTGYNIRRMSNILASKESAINIVLDFETISADVGPQHMAISAETQLTKAGILITEINKGRIDIGANRGHEIVSDHGIDIIQKLGVSERTANWVSREMEEIDEIQELKRKGNFDEIFEIWAKRKLKPEVDRYKGRSSRSFKNNIQMAEHVGEIIFQEIEAASRSGKTVFITTKNGNMFDLRLLEKFAPIAWAKIQKKHKHLIDLQSISYARQHGYGGSDALSLSKLLHQTMLRLDPNAQFIDLNDSKGGGIKKMVAWFSKKGYQIASTSWIDHLEKQGITLSAAHSTPLGDAILTQILLLDEHIKYKTGDKLYSDLGDFHRNLIRGKKMLGVDESMQEYRAQESRYTVYGRIASASLLSQGNIQQELVSLITSESLFPFPDNKLSKQWYQLFKGHANKPSTRFFAKKTDLEIRKIYNKNFKPSIMTQGELDTHQYLRQVGDDTAAMSHRVYTDTLMIWSPFRGKEGFQSFSKDVFDMREFHINKIISLNPNSILNDASLAEVFNRIQKNANSLAQEFVKGGEHMSAELMQKATEIAVSQEKDHIVFKPGVTLLTKGDRGMETYKSEIGGKLVNVFSTRDAAGRIKTYAEVKFIATGDDMESVAARSRSLFGKSIISINRLLSLGVSMGGPQTVMSADFISKGYLGSMKTFIAEQIHERLYGVLTDKNATAAQKERAQKAYDEFKLKLNAEVTAEGILVTKERDITGRLRNIKDPRMRKQAQMFIGGLDFGVDTMLKHMQDAKMVWTMRDMNMYYSMFGGKQKVELMVENKIKEATNSIDSMITEKNGVLQGIDATTRKRIHQDIRSMITSFLLPEEHRIKSKEGQATPFGFHREYYALNDSPLQFGIRGKVSHSVYGLIRGQQAEVKDIKLHCDLFKMIDIPGNGSDRDTLDILKDSVNAKHSDRFNAAYKTIIDFKNALMSGASGRGIKLNLGNIDNFIDRIGGINLASLKKRIIGGEIPDEITSMAEDLLQSGKDSGDIETLIKQFLDDASENNMVAAFEKNKRFITHSAVSRHVGQVALHTAKKGNIGAFSYSIGKEFTFNIKHLIKHSMNVADPEEAIEKAMSFFTKLAEQKDGQSFVKSVDKSKYEVKLKELIFHADESVENIYNSLNPAGKEETIGMLQNVAKKRQDAFEAIKQFEKQFDRLGRDMNKLDSAATVSHELLKSQYLTYLMNFALDSSSVYRQAFDMSPKGMYATIASAENILSTANTIIRNGNLSKIFKNEFKGNNAKAIKKAEHTLERIANNTYGNDVLVTETFFKTMKTRVDGKEVGIKHALIQQFGNDEGNKIYNSIKSGESKMPAFAVAHPTYQNAVDATLNLNLVVVPDTAAKYLGMNSNVMNVFTEMAHIQARDFDGDLIALAYKSLKSAKSMKDWQMEQGRLLQNIFKRQDMQAMMVEDTIAGQKVKRLGMGVDGFLNNGKAIRFGMDETGRFIREEIDSSAAPIDSLFSNSANLAMQHAMHNPDALTEKYVMSQMDMIAQVGVSKQNIGLFTNAFRKKVSQVLQAGIIKDPKDLALVIGNTTTGMGKMAQELISLAKHTTGIDDLAKVAKAFVSGNATNMEGEKALDEYIFKSFDSVDLPTEKRNKLISDIKASFKKVRYEENAQGIKDQMNQLFKIEVGADTADIMDLMMSHDLLAQSNSANRFAQSFDSGFSNLGETLKSKFKIDPEISSKFLSKGGKLGAIAAAGYLALNFFRPSQLSSSSNPMDAFTDLGVDFNGDYNILGNSPQLPRGVPLDTVDASFSKQAYIKLSRYNQDNSNKDISNAINKMLRQSFSNMNTFTADFREPPRVSYSNYTTNVGSFGSSTLQKRSNLL